MTDTPTPPTTPLATAATPTLTGFAKFVSMIVGGAIAWFKYIFGNLIPGAKWATGWTLTLTGVTSLWNGFLTLARNPTAAIFAGLLAVGGYALGHHEESRVWAPTAAKLKSTALQNIKLQQENDALKSRPTPVCAAPAPAPAAAPAKAKRKTAARTF